MLGAPGLVTSRRYAICVSPAPWNADLVAMLGAPGLMSSLGLRVCLYLRVSGDLIQILDRSGLLWPGLAWPPQFSQITELKLYCFA